MDKNYLYEKLAKKSLANLTTEINGRVGDLTHVDGELIRLSMDAVNKIKKICEEEFQYAYYITDIIISDIIATAKNKRLEIDVDKFFKDVEEIKDKLNSLEA